MKHVHPGLFPTYHVEDYAPPLDLSAYMVAAGDQKEDRERAAERSAALERSARQVVAGLARMVEDIRAGGIIEDNLAGVRRYVTEEGLKQAALKEHYDSEMTRLRLKREGLHKYRSITGGRDVIRDVTDLINDIEKIRNAVSIVRDAYTQTLEALSSIAPKHLSIADYATLSLIDERVAALTSLQEQLGKVAVSTTSSAPQVDNRSQAAQLVGPTLGGALLVGSLIPIPAGIAVGLAMGFLVGLARLREIGHQRR